MIKHAKYISRGLIIATAFATVFLTYDAMPTIADRVLTSWILAYVMLTRQDAGVLRDRLLDSKEKEDG